MLDLITKNFLVFSSLVLGVASTISMLFLTAYLGVFDWNLIWLIEYSDLTKLFLIGVGLLASILTSIIYWFQDVHTWLIARAPNQFWFFVVMSVLVLPVPLIMLYLDYKSANPLLTYHALRTLSWFILALLIVVAFQRSDNWRVVGWKAIGNDFAVLALFVTIVGLTLGHYVKDVSEYSRTITTKNGKFDGVKVIMFLSHHLAFLSDQKVVVVPTQDVTEIVSTSLTK
jgi:hypothetical protein